MDEGVGVGGRVCERVRGRKGEGENQEEWGGGRGEREHNIYHTRDIKCMCDSKEETGKG